MGMMSFKAGVKKGVNVEKTLEAVAAKKLAEIDGNTAKLLSAGFPYKGHMFSLELEARLNLMSVLPLASGLPYPFSWSDTDNAAVEIANAAELQALYAAMVGTGMTVKGGAVPLRAAVQNILAGNGTDEEKITAIEAIKDTRV